MKRGIAFAFIFILLLVSLSAKEIEMSDSYSQGQTLIAKIPGTLLKPITPNQITLYRGHVRLPAEVSVTEIYDDYYIYAQLLGNSEGNYSITIENVEYQKGAEAIKEDLTKEFKITNSTADFSVDKGFITTDKDFEIKMQNLNENPITITSTTDLQATPSSLSLKSGEFGTIKFSINNAEPGLQQLTLSSGATSYEIPLALQVENKTLERKMFFQPSSLEVPILLNYSNLTRRIISLGNNGEAELDNISLSISKQLQEYVILSSYTITSLDEGDSAQIELYFNSSNLTAERLIPGQITAREEYGGQATYAYLALSLNFSKAYKVLKDEVVNDTSKIAIFQTCVSQGGAICTSEETCQGTISESSDGLCCIGACSANSNKTSSSGKIIGYALLAVIAGFLIWIFFKKYKGTEKVVNLMNVAKGEK